MGRKEALAALSGGTGRSYALTWVPAEALLGASVSSGTDGIAEALAAVATRLSVDLVFVPSGEIWSESAVRLLADADIASAWTVPGVLGAAAERLGWADTLRRSAGSPGSLAFPLDEALADSAAAVRRGVSAEADVLVVADDLAGDSGWLVAPDFAIEALVPCYRHLIREWYPARPALFHSDGDIRALIPALARLGFRGVHFGQLECDRRAAVASGIAEAGLVPLGGIESRSLMGGGGFGSCMDVVDAVGHHPYIIADDGGITTAEELQSFAVALESMRAREAGDLS